MKRAEIAEGSVALKLVDTNLPQTPAKGARLKTAYTGVCRGDLHFTDGSGLFNRPGEEFPGIVPGHEVAAIIEDFGPEANPDDHNLKLGDCVIVYPWVGCGKCETCKIDLTHECKENPGLRFSCGFGHANPGGYATHMVVQGIEFLIKIPENIPRHVACMLPCSGLTAFTAVKKARSFLEDGYTRSRTSKLLIIGAGGLGLWAIQLAKAMFADKNIEITVAGVSPVKNNVAKANGADFATQVRREINNREDFLAETAEMTKNGKYLFDAAIDFVGSSTTFRLAYGCIRPSGALVSAGTYGGKFDLSVVELVLMQYSIQGNRTGTIFDLKELTTLVHTHKIQYPAVEYASLEDINAIFDKLRNKKINGRVLIKFEDK